MEATPCQRSPARPHEFARKTQQQCSKNRQSMEAKLKTMMPKTLSNWDQQLVTSSCAGHTQENSHFCRREGLAGESNNCGSTNHSRYSDSVASGSCQKLASVVADNLVHSIPATRSSSPAVDCLGKKPGSTPEAQLRPAQMRNRAKAFRSRWKWALFKIRIWLAMAHKRSWHKMEKEIPSQKACSKARDE